MTTPANEDGLAAEIQCIETQRQRLYQIEDIVKAIAEATRGCGEEDYSAGLDLTAQTIGQIEEQLELLGMRLKRSQSEAATTSGEDPS